MKANFSNFTLIELIKYCAKEKKTIFSEKTGFSNFFRLCVKPAYSSSDSKALLFFLLY